MVEDGPRRRVEGSVSLREPSPGRGKEVDGLGRGLREAQMGSGGPQGETVLPTLIRAEWFT
jgi:hypothetical protein